MMVLVLYYLKKQSIYMFYLVHQQQKNIDVHLYVNHLLIGKISFLILIISKIISSSSEFTIECQGVGVLPPLSLSSTVIHFPATPINDQSIAVFYVENRHLDKNHFKHPVPRIGNGKLITMKIFVILY